MSLFNKRDLAVGVIVSAMFYLHLFGIFTLPALVVIAASIWFGAHWGFLALVWAEQVLRDNPGGWWATHTAPLAITFVIIDWLFNWTFGSWFFRAAPMNWDELFSERVQFYADRGPPEASVGIDHERWVTSQKWKQRLNAAAPGHIA